MPSKRTFHHPCIVTLIFLFSAVSLQSNPITYSVGVVYYVTPAGAGTQDGSSWLNAAPGNLLQVIIDNAASGDSVWVACGVYRPTTTTNRAISFHMRQGITIIGSFQGNETQYSERAFICGPCSELSGDIGVPGVMTDNSYKVIVNIGLDETASIDGFRITGGRDDRPPTNNGNGLGGGVYNGGSAQYNEGGNCSPVFQNCVIDQNYATYGAGMFNNGHDNGRSSPILMNCIFANNVAVTGGGGMDSYGWNNGDVAPELHNCIFYNNVSGDRAGAMYCWGGLNGNCSPLLQGCAFINNTSAVIAGGVIVDNSDNLAGNPPFSGTAEVTSVNSIFWGNVSPDGPQFYILGTGHFTATHTSIDTIGQTTAHPISGSGSGNLFVFPELLDTTNAQGLDGCWMTLDDGLTLLISSTCINSGESNGSTALDLAFSPRVSGSNIDIGPYEFVLPDTVMWTGASSTDWFENANWEPARVPDSLQIVIVPGAPLNQPLIALDTAYCNGLIIHDNGTLHVQELLQIKTP